MRLALLPTTTEVLPGNDPKTVVSPVFNTSFNGRWGQASSLWAPQGLMLVWLDVEENEVADLIIRGLPVIPDLYVRNNKADMDRAREVHRKSVELKDMRKKAETGGSVSSRESWRRKRLDLALKMAEESLLPSRGIAEAIREQAKVFEAQSFRQMDGPVAYTVVHQDDFNRSNRELHGDTLSDSTTTWYCHYGTGRWSISSNKAYKSFYGGVNHLTPNGMTVAANMFVQATLRSSDWHEVLARASATTEDWYSFANWAGSYGAVFKCVSGTRTRLGSTTTKPVDGDIIAVETSSTSISGLLNASVVSGPNTDSTFADGKAGLQTDYGHMFDDWSAATEAAAGILKQMMAQGLFVGDY